MELAQRERGRRGPGDRLLADDLAVAGLRDELAHDVFLGVATASEATLLAGSGRLWIDTEQAVGGHPPTARGHRPARCALEIFRCDGHGTIARSSPTGRTITPSLVSIRSSSAPASQALSQRRGTSTRLPARLISGNWWLAFRVCRDRLE